MFITREIDYAIRVVRVLGKGGKKTIDEICQDELIPRQFSYKILKKLEKSGVVRIFRGAGGGYALKNDILDGTLFDIVTAINTNPLLSECLGHGYDCPLNSKDGKLCGVHIELNRIQEHVFALLKEKSLRELFNQEPFWDYPRDLSRDLSQDARQILPRL